jgi:hypothetical protein
VATCDIEKLRNLSRTLFGQALRLEVMIAIAKSDGLVNLTDLAAAIGIQNSSRIQKPLDDLKTAGLLIEHTASDSRRRWLRRSNSLVWQWVLELAAEYGYDPGSEVWHQEVDSH